MQNPFNNPFFPSMKRVAQRTTVHCGPAVLEMLFSYLGVYIDQNEFVKAAGIQDSLAEYGMTVTEMARSARALYPYSAFWYKQNMSLEELGSLVSDYHFPVGVEWQGVFLEDEDDDNGHYSVVTHLDLQSGVVVLADPYIRFAGVDRQFSVAEFTGRWWDENEVLVGNHRQLVRETQMGFLVAPQEATFPEMVGMIKND